MQVLHCWAVSAMRRCTVPSVGPVVPVRREMLLVVLCRSSNVWTAGLVLTWWFSRARLTRWDGAAALLRDRAQECASAARASVLSRLGNRRKCAGLVAGPVPSQQSGLPCHHRVSACGSVWQAHDSGWFHGSHSD